MHSVLWIKLHSCIKLIGCFTVLPGVRRTITNNYSVCDIGSKNRISDRAAGFWNIKKISGLSILQLHICCTPIWCTSSHLSPFWNSIKNEIANSRVPYLKVITSALQFKFICSPRRCTIQNTPTILGTHKAIRNEYCFLAGKSDILGRRFAVL
jgi:hypothetical protein